MKLRSYTDPPDRLLEHRSLFLCLRGDWRLYSVEASGRSAGQLTVKLAGVGGREQAQALKGAAVSVPRSDLPPRGVKDYYRADLIGCEVVNLEGARLGVVEYFVETPAHPIMVVRGEQEFWVPAVPQHLRRVELEQRRVLVDWDEASTPAG